MRFHMEGLDAWRILTVLIPITIDELVHIDRVRTVAVQVDEHLFHNGSRSVE